MDSGIPHMHRRVAHMHHIYVCTISLSGIHVLTYMYLCCHIHGDLINLLLHTRLVSIPYGTC